jgi:hypothetical protein
MQTILSVLEWLPAISLACFLTAFIGMVVSRWYINRQLLEKARVWAFISATAASAVLFFESAAFFMTFSVFAAIMAVIWGYFAYISWRLYADLKKL